MTSEPPAGTAEACDMLEAALPDGEPSGADWSAFTDELVAIAPEFEDPTVVSGLVVAMGLLSVDPTGTARLDARESLRDALDDLAEVCAAAGTDALQ